MGKSEWKEAFSLIDESGIGRIPTKKFGQAVRCAGGYPTEENLKDMVSLVWQREARIFANTIRILYYLKRLNLAVDVITIPFLAMNRL